MHGIKITGSTGPAKQTPMDGTSSLSWERLQIEIRMAPSPEAGSHAATLVRAQEFRSRQNASGHLTFNARGPAGNLAHSHSSLIFRALRQHQ